MLLVLCLISAVFNAFWTSEHYKTDWYLGIDSEWNIVCYLYQVYVKVICFICLFHHLDVVSKNFGYNLLTFIILYNNLIPISLQVTLELVRFLQVRFSLLSYISYILLIFKYVFRSYYYIMEIHVCFISFNNNL